MVNLNFLFIFKFKFFNVISKNNNNTKQAFKISYNEALEIFKKYDKNKDGKMNRKEFKPAFKELISYKMTNDEINDSVSKHEKI